MKREKKRTNLARKRSRRVHLRPNAVEPLKRTVESDLDPTRGASDRLAAVFVAPALDERDAHGALFGELIDGVVAFGDGPG